MTRNPSHPAVLAFLLTVGCASTSILETPRRGTTQQGLASWYGPKFHGRPTASGEIYDMNRISAAHKQLPFGTVVEVRNKETGKTLRVPINDRGPFIKGRIIDLSLGAARELDLFGAGLAKVRVRVVRTAPKVRKLPISYPARQWPGRSATAADAAASAGKPGGGSRRSGFTIQAGAFREQSGAARLARRLRQDLGLNKVRILKKGGWYRVQISRRREKAAEAVRQKLAQANIEAIVLR